ncbi:MAG: asparagine synthase (glutamine-hydrolyzing) [Candidatus Contendobacter sp.]|nr:asparagine synthase (glutamine-hydrolyzing) [Candidatus Contendobacter sp.]
MCGLAFLYQPELDPVDARSRVESALFRLRHRGPDEEGLMAAGEAVLGHRRLSIIDLSGSHQPLADLSGRHWLVFNGEIYNYVEVRDRWLQDWPFRNQGDTEVLLAALVTQGVAALQGMEGMWAFAWWDTEAKRLVLGRDRMGKKPLYFRVLPGGIACASELPALRALDAGAWSEDVDSTADYLRYGYPLPGFTAYQEVREVLPGHVLTWSAAAGVRQEPYWRLELGTFTGGPAQARIQLREALIRAVERRLVADVEVGAFLSGGVDSSLVAGIVRRELGRPLKTFTIGFREKAFDERVFAQLAADAFGAEHEAEVLENWNEADLEQLINQHVGQPFADASLLPTTLVSQVAARQVKVVLSGDGGDELFSGYQRYQARALLRWYTRLPGKMRMGVERLVRALPEPMAHLFVDVAARQAAETPYVAPLMFSPEQLRALAPDLAGRGHLPPGIPEATEPDDLQRMMAADALVYLPQDILVKVDRASMAQSLEVRAPFLDREVVELAFSLPRRWHRRGWSGKRMLRETFGDLLPGVLWRRRKQGFGVPLHDWFRGRLGERLQEWLMESPGPLSASVVGDLLGAHQAWRRDHGYRLWLIYVYLLWRRGLK